MQMLGRRVRHGLENHEKHSDGTLEKDSMPRSPALRWAALCRRACRDSRGHAAAAARRRAGSMAWGIKLARSVSNCARWGHS